MTKHSDASEARICESYIDKQKILDRSEMWHWLADQVNEWILNI